MTRILRGSFPNMIEVLNVSVAAQMSSRVIREASIGEVGAAESATSRWPSRSKYNFCGGHNEPVAHLTTSHS
jgi:hypothetical protein